MRYKKRFQLLARICTLPSLAAPAQHARRSGRRSRRALRLLGPSQRKNAGHTALCPECIFRPAAICSPAPK